MTNQPIATAAAPSTPLRFSFLTSANAAAKEDGKPCKILQGTLSHHPVRIIIDSRTSSNFISSALVQRHQLTTAQRNAWPVCYPYGTKNDCTPSIPRARLRIDDCSDHLPFILTDLGQTPIFDVFLGTPCICLASCNPAIDWITSTLVFPHDGRIHTMQPPPILPANASLHIVQLLSAIQFKRKLSRHNDPIFMVLLTPATA